MKANKLLLMVLVLVFGVALAANAATTLENANFYVTDLYDDLNTLVSVDQGNAIFEDYNETFLIPYPSHDGFAIVNQFGQFFDKEFIAKKDFPGVLQIVFKPSNTTGYVWSDYHFELDPLNSGVTFFGPSSGTNNFLNEFVSTSDYLITFAGEEYVDSPNDNTNFTIGLSGVDEGDIFIIRQIATTTVPIPGSLVLLGTGILGLVGLRRQLL